MSITTIITSSCQQNSTTKQTYIISCLFTRDTLLDLYRKLIELHREGKVSFGWVVTFNLGEYIRLPDN